VHIHFPWFEILIAKVTLNLLVMTQEISIREFNTKRVIIVEEKIW
jgi:hypothetical protein